MKRKIFSLTILTCAIIFLSPIFSPAAQIAYINYSGGYVDYLTEYGHTVTYLNNPLGLTLEQLSGYDAVLVASNQIFTDPTTIGNVLADFANEGHGVVLTQFDFQGSFALSGTIMNQGYSPFTVDSLDTDFPISENIATVYNPSSPLFSEINTANIQTYFEGNVGLDPGATLLADWGSGRHAIAYNTLSNSSVVALNLFPDSTYTSDADTQRLVANAVAFSLTGGTPVPEPTTLLLLGSGLVGLIGFKKKLRK
jgi:hypothetical protein